MGEVHMAARPIEVNPALIALIDGRNVVAVRADLRSWSARSVLVADSDALQALALTLAMTLDLGAGPNTSQAAKELRATLTALRIPVTSPVSAPASEDVSVDFDVDADLLDEIGGLNTYAVMSDLTVWRSKGALAADTTALQALALTLAMTLDDGAGPNTSQIAKEMRATLEELRIDVAQDADREFVDGLGEPVGESDPDTGAAVPAKVRNPKVPAKKNVRAASGKGDGRARPAADAVAATRTGRRARS